MILTSTVQAVEVSSLYRFLPNALIPKILTGKDPEPASPVIAKCISPTYSPNEGFFTDNVMRCVDLALPSLIKKGLEPIFLHIGAPTELPPEQIVQELAASQSRDKAHTYASPSGEQGLRTEISKFMKRRFDADINPDKEICVLPGSCPGIFTFTRDILRKEKGVILLPSPGYPPYYTAARKAGHDVCTLPLTAENNFMPDVSEAISMLDNAGKAGDILAVFVNYPHNPTGAVANYKYLESIITLARKYNFLVVSDMAYSEIYDPQSERPHSIFEIPGAKEVGIEFHTFGKTFSMTGDRIAFVVARSELAVLFPAKAKHENIGSPPKTIQSGIEHGLNNEQCWAEVERRNYEYRERFNLMISGLKKLDWKIDDFKRSGFFLWVRVPESNVSSKEFFSRLLYNAGVVTVPGSDFGEEGEGYMRISLTQPIPVLEAVLKRLEVNGFNYS